MPPKRAPKQATSRTRSTRLAPPKAPAVLVPQERIGRAGPLAGVSTAPGKLATQQTASFIGADIARIGSALAQAAGGYIGPKQDLYDYMRDRDPRVDAVCRTRILAITGRQFAVKPPLGFDNDAEAIEIAERVSIILSRIRAGAIGTGDGGGPSTALGQIADGVLRGISVNEIEWGVSAEGWHVPRALHWRHPNRFRFDSELQLRLSDGGREDTLIDDFGPDKFVIHSPSSGRATYPMGRGALQGCIFPSLFKRSDLGYWVKGTERFGQPLLVMQLPENASAELVAESETLINKIAVNFNGALKGDISLAQVPGTGTLNPAIFREFADFLNLEITIAVLGNNLTTEIQGGSFAAAQTARELQYDYLGSDMAELDDTRTAQLVEPIVRYNWPGAPVPVIVTELSSQTAPSLEDVKDGVFSEDEYRSAKGYEPKPDGAGSEYRAPLIAVPAAIGETDDADALIDAGTPVAETALNGAQVTAMQGIVESAAANALPRESAIALLMTGFQLDRATAEGILGNIGQGVPAAEPSAQPPGGADAGIPLATTQTNGRSTSQTSEPSASEHRRRRLQLLAASAPSPRSAD